MCIRDKFLDYARPEQTTPERVHLNQVIESATFVAKADADTVISTAIEPNLMVMGEATELQRVFSNLIENAQRYGRHPVTGVAQIDIAARAKDDWVLIKLRDHGTGVTPEQLTQLTQPFYRGDPSRSSASGTGLGLAIVEKAIQRMGGRFALANSSTGGLAAHIKLPRAKTG